METSNPAELRSVTPEQLRAGAQAIIDKGGAAKNVLGMAQTKFGQEEQQRRKLSPIFVSGDDVAREHERVDSVYIVDSRLGFANKTNRFWINHLPGGGEEKQKWKTIGHRHTVEAVIYYMEGHGYSVIDGTRYDWEAGDFICVPQFAWHRHVNLSEHKVPYAASTTGPLSMGIGQAVYEDERYPELWVFAQQGEDAMGTLIPGGAEAAVSLEEYDSAAARLYSGELNFALAEEAARRKSRVLVKGSELSFERTPMGRVAYVVDNRIGFHTKALATVIGEVDPGKHSGAHRHLYDEVDYVLAGTGQATVDDVTFDIKPGDTLAIPPYAWHQYFNTGDEPMRVLAFSTRPMLESLGLSLVQQGEVANF
jgi:gentisate 1,2-dioxygenase